MGGEWMGEKTLFAFSRLSTRADFVIESGAIRRIGLRVPGAVTSPQTGKKP